MKPCDCMDSVDCGLMDHHGIAINSMKIEVIPPNVVLTNGSCTMRFSQTAFRQFAEWYLEEQGNPEFNRMVS